MSHARRSPHMNVMIDAAEKAGRGLLRDFGEVEQLQVSKKGPHDFVSNADVKAENLVKSILLKGRPGFAFLMEESGETAGDEGAPRWIVDPLDGTTNFLHGIPHWSVSIALEKDGEIVAGAVYDPVKDEMFWAEKGLGAYMNNRRIQVSGRARLADALLATGDALLDVGVNPANSVTGEILALKNACGGMRRFGSAALDLAYVAAGRIDAYWERGLAAWDVAAGSLIVKEARGIVTDASGGKNFIHGRNSILAANAQVHGDMLRALSSALKQKEKAAS